MGLPDALDLPCARRDERRHSRALGKRFVRYPAAGGGGISGIATVFHPIIAALTRSLGRGQRASGIIGTGDARVGLSARAEPKLLGGLDHVELETSSDERARCVSAAQVPYRFVDDERRAYEVHGGLPMTSLWRRRSIVLSVGAISFLSVTATHAADKDCIAAASEGQELRDQGHLLDARADFQMCAQSECPEPIPKFCADWMTDVRRNIATVVIRAVDNEGRDVTEARVVVDD